MKPTSVLLAVGASTVYGIALVDSSIQPIPVLPSTTHPNPFTSILPTTTTITLPTPILDPLPIIIPPITQTCVRNCFNTLISWFAACLNGPILSKKCSCASLRAALIDASICLRKCGVTTPPCKPFPCYSQIKSE